MRHSSIRSAVIGIAIAISSANIARAQSETSTEVLKLNPHDSWEAAQGVGSSWVSESKRKLVVVTVDQPQRRLPCRVQSFTADKIVCSRAFGGSRTYTPQQVLALIIPGDAGLKVKPVLGLNVALGTAIWATVVLAAACPACAVATGIAAFVCFGAAGAILIGDEQPDQLLYVAPGRRLSHRLGYVQE